MRSDRRGSKRQTDGLSFYYTHTYIFTMSMPKTSIKRENANSTPHFGEEPGEEKEDDEDGQSSQRANASEEPTREPRRLPPDILDEAQRKVGRFETTRHKAQAEYIRT